MSLIDNIKSEYLSHKNIAGLYAMIESDDDIRFYLVELENEKQKIKIRNRKSDIPFSELHTFLTQKTPVCLAISGRGIIHKRIETAEGITGEQIIHKVLPNASSEEFYLQQQVVNENEVYASLVRKEFVHEITDKLKEENIQIIDISFGPFAVNNILDLFSEEIDEIETLNFKLNIQQKRIHTIQRTETISEKTYRLGDEDINTKEIIPFASAVAYFMQTTATNFVFEPVKKNREDLQFKKYTHVAGWSSLIFFFILLLVNYFFYEKYNSTYNHLNKQYFQNEKLIQHLNELKKEYTTKEQFITETGMLNPTRFSFYADKIGMHLPSTITLTKMDIQPISGRVKQLKEIDYTPNKIIVNGFTSSSGNVDQWLKVLKEENWVQDIEIISINKAEKTSSIEFSIEITFL